MQADCWCACRHRVAEMNVVGKVLEAKLQLTANDNF